MERFSLEVFHNSALVYVILLPKQLPDSFGRFLWKAAKTISRWIEGACPFCCLNLKVLRHLKIISLNPLGCKLFLLIPLFALEHGVEILTDCKACGCLMGGFSVACMEFVRADPFLLCMVI